MNLYLGNGKIGLFTFLASAHPADTCGTDGLPVTPNSIKIMGRFQALKLLSHPNLCGYVDVLRGKHERLIIVAEHYDNNLQRIFEEDDVPLKVNQIQSIACQTIQAINYLHSYGYVHRNISASNVLFDSDDKLKLSRYGLYHMTNYNSDVRFPIGDIRYMAPEVLLLGVNYNALYGPSTTSIDVWSFGMLLLDCFLHGKLWGKLRLSEEKVAMILLDIATMKENVNPLERIINVSNCRGKFEQMDSSLNSLIAACLCADPEKRPLLEELMLHEFIQLRYIINYPKKDLQQFPAIYRSAHLELPDFNKLILEASNTEEENHLSGRPIEEVYHLWNLAGGDVFSVLRKHNLVNSKSPALTLPLALLNNGEEFGISEKESLTCISTAVAVSLDQLQQRLEHIDPMAYYPLIVEDNLYTVDLSATAELPLVIREKDVEYQFHRIILLERLLDGYPYTRNRIIKESRIDIAPYIRAKVWAALLNITGDISSNYKNIDKDSVTPTDRQIDVDIPRCHQYNNLLSSPTGHEKLKSVLKAWVASHPHLVYWQGLDSLCAPFVALNFNNEALAYSCLKAFIPKYLYNFFQKDNGPVIQEYLAVFKQLIAFHLPDLYNHLEDIGFNPELYAIPWFLTMFSHVFPLHKIYYLWDTLLLGTSLLPLCIGLAILQQFREQLLAFGFNDCILLFSDMPTIDIERCVKESIKIFNKTPPSAGFRKEDNPGNRTRAPAEEQFMNLPDKEQLSFAHLRLEVCPRVSPRDLVRISQLIQQADAFPLLSRDGTPKNNKEKKKRRNKKDRQVSIEVQTKLIVIDVRSQEEFSSGHLPYSVNVPFSQAVSKEYEWQHSTPVTKIVHANKGKMMMVIGNKGPEPVQLAQILVSLGYRRICVMDGSVSILRNLGYLTAISTS